MKQGVTIRILPSFLFHVLLMFLFFVALMSANTSATEINQVTMSRIASKKIVLGAPIKIYTRDDIDRSGDFSTADFIRNLPSNNFGSSRPRSGQSDQGLSAVGLRGLSENRTLILLDGRRLPKYPFAADTQDLNIIPIAYVERIEVLSESASAIYGSDAVGGVINIITRKNLDGTYVDIGFGKPSIPASGGEISEGSILYGERFDQTAFSFGVSWNDTAATYKRDYPWTGVDRSYFSNNYGILDDTGSAGFSDAIPGGCNFPGTPFYLSYSNCYYDSFQIMSDDASIKNRSVWFNVNHQLNSQWSLSGKAGAYLTDSFSEYAPVPDSSIYFDSLLSANSSNNPTNPTGWVYDGSSIPQPVNWWHRFASLGNREDYADSQVQNLQLTANGTVNEIALEVGLSIFQNKSKRVGYNYLLRQEAVSAIESGEYSLLDPYSVPESVLDSIRATITNRGKYDINEVFSNATFELYKIGKRTAKAVVGGEYRRVSFYDYPDNRERNNQIGGSSNVALNAEGSRDVLSLYFETLMPLTDDIQVNLAGRFDDFDDISSEFSPRLSLNWQLRDGLSLRASYNQSYVAPSLSLLGMELRTETRGVGYGPGWVCLYTCEYYPDVEVQTGNSDLISEQSEEFSVGVNYELKDTLVFSMNYWNSSIENIIRYFDARSLVFSWDSQITEDYPSGLDVVRSEEGTPISVTEGYGNYGSLETAGVDLEFKYISDSLESKIEISHLLEQTMSSPFDITGSSGELIKTEGKPENRMRISTTYQRGIFAFTHNLNLIGSQTRYYRGTSPDYSSWITQDLQVNIKTFGDGRITIGAKNILNKKPPLISSNLNGRRFDYNFDLYNGYGRINYVRYSQSF